MSGTGADDELLLEPPNTVVAPAAKAAAPAAHHVHDSTPLIGTRAVTGGARIDSLSELGGMPVAVISSGGTEALDAPRTPRSIAKSDSPSPSILSYSYF